MLTNAASILGAVSADLGRSCVLDTGIGPAAVRDFVSLVHPVLSEWKLGWTSWYLCDRSALLEKIRILTDAEVRVVAGGTGGEIAAYRGKWADHVSLCRELGIQRVEIGEGFMGQVDKADRVVSIARENHLEIQYELGLKDVDADRAMTMEIRLRRADRWIEAGVDYLILEAREVGEGFAVFPPGGGINREFVDALLERLPLSRLIFEAPTRGTQVALLVELGPGVHLANIDPRELLRVEAFRRALHADTIHFALDTGI